MTSSDDHSSSSDSDPKVAEGNLGGGIGRTLFSFTLLGVTAALISAVGAYLVYDHVTRERPSGPEVAFQVPEGATGNEVARLLAQAGLVEHELFFRLAIRLDPSAESIKHGTFQLPTNVSPTQILHLLRERVPESADPDAFRVTVPEGLTIAQSSEHTPDSEAFLAAVGRLDSQQLLGIDVPTFEGFLMPNTYFFSEEPTAADIVLRMVEQFNKDYGELLGEIPEAAERDLVEVVTVASLIEEEARTDNERANIASVVYNRLKLGRALELDSTLQFALNKYGQRLLNEDKQVDSPYNTYRRAGLPPGPISNPSVASLRAALDPAETDFLYFVSNADGMTHTFSRNLAEHNAAVAKYRREIRKQRREQAQEQ